MLMLRELTHPLRNLLHNLINNLLHTRINLTILRNQIASMEPARHDLHRNILRALQGSIGPQIRRHAGLAPRVELAVDVDQTLRVHIVPAVGVAVDVFFGAALGDAVLGAVGRGREVQAALADPVVCVDEAGDDGRAIARRAVLPVAEGLVARHPDPLAGDGVAEGGVGEHGVGSVVGVEAVGVELAGEVAEALAVAWEEVVLGPGGVAFEGFLETDAAGAGDGGVGGEGAVGAVADLAGVDVLDVVAPVEEAGVAVELVTLPEPGAVLERGHEIVVVLDVLQTELGLEGEDFLFGAVDEDIVHVVDDEADISAAVLGHSLLDGQEVSPVVRDRLDGSAGRVVCPDGARVYSLDPSSQCTRIRSTREDPWHIFRVAVRVLRERQLDFVGEVGEIVDCVVQGEVLKVLGSQVGERCGSTPVAVLQHDGGSTDLLSNDTSGAVGAKVAGVAGCVDLAGCEEDDRGACVVLSVAGVHVVVPPSCQASICQKKTTV
jgi:hypothetical protein